MRTQTVFAWRMRHRLPAIGLVVWWLALGLAPWVHAGTQLTPTEDTGIETPGGKSIPPSSEMALDPIEPQQLQRIDPEATDTIRDLAALTQLADSPAIRAQLKSKRLPKGRDALAAGNAAWTLGLIYLHGAGVPQDPSQAQHWFERALALGTRKALAGMAWCAIEGCARLPEPEKADQWTVPLRRIDRPRALYLQWLALDRLAPLRTATPDLQTGESEPALVAPHLLAESARGGNIHALIELGLNAVAEQRTDRALAFFRRAADRSDVAAANAAIVAQAAPPKTEPRSDASKVAMELLSQAQRFHRGEGVAPNYAEAIRLYRMAAAKGSQEAERMLALIYSRPLVRGNVDIGWVNQLGELDLSQATPSLRTRTSPRQLQRESTALVDLLPKKWRDKVL